jgi:hypothetical protein
VVVEAVEEVSKGLVELLDGAVAVELEQLLLERADEPLDAAVAFGLVRCGALHSFLRYTFGKRG